MKICPPMQLFENDTSHVLSEEGHTNKSETRAARQSDNFRDEPLPTAFQAAIETYPVVPFAEVNIVLVVSYYRSGSTFTGELLSAGPKTFFHFEPLMMFTVSGRLRRSRERYAFRLLDALAMCQMENVPLYMMWFQEKPKYFQYNRFLWDLCGTSEACFSPHHVASLCARAKAQVFKFTRLHISQVSSWIKRQPNLRNRIHIVHLVRDPRAIYASRRGLRWCTDNKECDSAEVLCEQLSSDLDAFEELKQEIGSSRTHRLRFEDLAVDPVNETLRLYQKLGLSHGQSVSEYLNGHTKATAKDMKDAHSTRRNSTTVPEIWKAKLPKQTIASIQKVCNDTLQRLGYTFLQEHS
ncbi:carbohydrate sulfotransferase 4-like [Haemaphysalis longicornis]